jgi:hypothetical protein
MKMTKNYSHDSMSLSVKFETGGSFSYRVGRSGERLEVCFSNDDNTLMGETNSFKCWTNLYENNGERFEALESLLKAQGGCKSGKQVISRMRYEMSIKPTVVTVK